MAGLFPSRHPASGRVSWPRGLQRAAFLLAASVALFWSSVAFGRWMIPIPDSGPIYGDLLIAWVAVLVHISAWPNLWAGLRDLRAREPNGASILVAWRAFLLTVVVIVAAVAILVFEYRAIVSPDAWMFILYDRLPVRRLVVCPNPGPPRRPLRSRRKLPRTAVSLSRGRRRVRLVHCGRRDARRRPPESRGNRIRTSLELGLRNPPGSGTGGLRPG